MAPSNMIQVDQGIISSWFKGKQTLGNQEVGNMFREPFIISWYRPPNKPWKYYAMSLFHLHNETFNVWSHLLPFCIFLYKIYTCSLQLDFLGHPQGCAFLGFAFGSLAYTLLSSIAHLFHSKSELAHMTLYQLDYLGIALNSIGTCIVSYHFCGTSRFYKFANSFFLPVNFLAGFAICVSCSLTQLLHLRPHSLKCLFLKVGIVTLHALYAAIPLVFRLYECISESDELEENCPDGYIFRHLRYGLCFATGTIFYATAFPERMIPGTFDLIGYGHGLFHITSALTTVMQYDAAIYEMKHTAPSLVHQMTGGRSTCGLIMTGICAVIVLDVIFIIVTHPIRIKRAEEIHTKRNL